MLVEPLGRGVAVAHLQRLDYFQMLLNREPDHEGRAADLRGDAGEAELVAVAAVVASDDLVVERLDQPAMEQVVSSIEQRRQMVASSAMAAASS